LKILAREIQESLGAEGRRQSVLVDSRKVVGECLGEWQVAWRPLLGYCQAGPKDSGEHCQCGAVFLVTESHHSSSSSWHLRKGGPEMNNDFGGPKSRRMVLSVLIGVHLWPICLFRQNHWPRINTDEHE
jgi:hypothetical protein